MSNLPEILVKVGNFTISHDGFPNFIVMDEPPFRGYGERKSHIDVEKREKFIMFMVDAFRQALERSL